MTKQKNMLRVLSSICAEKKGIALLKDIHEDMVKTLAADLLLSFFMPISPHQDIDH
jgi:hypothetical protein